MLQRRALFIAGVCASQGATAFLAPLRGGRAMGSESSTRRAFSLPTASVGVADVLASAKFPAEWPYSAADFRRQDESGDKVCGDSRRSHRLWRATAEGERVGRNSVVRTSRHTPQTRRTHTRVGAIARLPPPVPSFFLTRVRVFPNAERRRSPSLLVARLALSSPLRPRRHDSWWRGTAVGRAARSCGMVVFAALAAASFAAARASTRRRASASTSTTRRVQRWVRRARISQDLSGSISPISTTPSHRCCVHVAARRSPR